MAEENCGSRSNISLRFKRYLGESPFFCKIIELLLCVIAVCLFTGPFNNNLMPNLNHAGIIYVATCGFIMINAVLVICYLLGEKLGKKTALTFCGLGAILCLTAGIILIYDKNNVRGNFITRYEEEYLGQMMASAVFILLAAGVFLIDIYLTNKYD